MCCVCSSSVLFLLSFGFVWVSVLGFLMACEVSVVPCLFLVHSCSPLLFRSVCARIYVCMLHPLFTSLCSVLFLLVFGFVCTIFRIWTVFWHCPLPRNRWCFILPLVSPNGARSCLRLTVSRCCVVLPACAILYGALSNLCVVDATFCVV